MITFKRLIVCLCSQGGQTLSQQCSGIAQVEGFQDRIRQVKGLEGREQGDQSLIGVLIGDLSFDFTAELMDGITDAANAFGVRVVFLLGMQKHSAQGSHDNNKAEAINSNSVYDYAGLIGADAFIIACGSLSGFSGDGLYQQFLNRFQNQPCVVLQERVQIDAPQKTYIVVDNYHSFSQCIEHLIVDHGYRKIALVSGPEGHLMPANVCVPIGTACSGISCPSRRK